GNAAFKKGNYALAVEQYSMAIDEDRTKSVYFINRAMALIKLERYAKAIDDCTQGIKLDPKNVKAFWRRGTARLHLGEYEEAKRSADKTTTTKSPATTRQVPRSSPSLMMKPANSQDFERAWREHRHSAADLYRYLKMVPASELPGLFRASLESGHISDIARASEFARDEEDDGGFVLDTLSALPRVARFGLASLFLDSSD
ncbi:TPR-like protein, partial [Martensiomyces pterosporus]